MQIQPQRGVTQRVRCGNGDGRRGCHQGVNADEANGKWRDALKDMTCPLSLNKSLRKNMDEHALGGGFKYFLFLTPTWGNDPI